MKPDLYTKAVLTMIMVLLAVIACKTVISPETTVSAQGPLSEVQWDGHEGFFDPRTGEVWQYFTCAKNINEGCQVAHKIRVTKLGQPLLNEYQR